MEFEFHTRRPGPPLEPFVESVWFARGRIPYRRERIAPTGSTVAVLVLGSPILQIARNGAGERLPAAERWLAGPHEGPVINAPTAETLADPAPDRAFALVGAALREGLELDVPGWRRCAAATAALEAEPRRPVAAIAAEARLAPWRRRSRPRC